MSIFPQLKPLLVKGFSFLTLTTKNNNLYENSLKKTNLLTLLQHKRALLLLEEMHPISKTGLHPLDRHDEGMIGLRPVETWEGKPPGAAWRMRAVYGNNWSLDSTPLFKYAFM